MMREKDRTEREYGHQREKNDAPARAMAAGRTTTGAAGGAGLGKQWQHQRRQMLEMSSSSLKAVVLLLLAVQFGCAQDQTSCGPSSNGAFDYQVTPTDGFDIHWSVDTVAETVSVEVVSTAVAWTSLGFSSDFLMLGSDAVIGLPEESAVEEYNLTSQAVSGVVASETQDITGGAVSQDASGTTLSFTRPLAPSDKQAISGTPGDTTIFLYAFGEDNELGFHGLAPNRGSLFLDLFCGATVAGTPAPTGGGTPVSSAASSTAPIVADTPTPPPTTAPTMVVLETPPPSASSTAPTALLTLSPLLDGTTAPAAIASSGGGDSDSATVGLVAGVLGVGLVVGAIVAVVLLFKTGRLKPCRHGTPNGPSPGVGSIPAAAPSATSNAMERTQLPAAIQYPEALRP